MAASKRSVGSKLQVAEVARYDIKEDEVTRSLGVTRIVDYEVKEDEKSREGHYGLNAA